MTAFIAFLLTNKFLVGAMAAIVGLFGIYAKGQLAGAAKERAKQSASEAKARTIADEIDDAVAGRAPANNLKGAKLCGWKP